MSQSDLLHAFVTLLVVVDPIGTVPMFLVATAGMAAADRRRVATLASLVAAGVLLGFLFLGQFLLHALGIGIPAFQISGGIVLFLIALRMVFFGHEEAAPAAKQSVAEIAVFPVAMPAIAGPGAILAVVLLSDGQRFHPTQQAVAALVTLVVLALAWLTLRLAASIERWLGHVGIIVVSRVLGLILAALSVQAVLDGVKRAFPG
jgi:multiple antibiotic resistance protein